MLHTWEAKHPLLYIRNTIKFICKIGCFSNIFVHFLRKCPKITKKVTIFFDTHKNYLYISKVTIFYYTWPLHPNIHPSTPLTFRSGVSCSSGQLFFKIIKYLSHNFFFFNGAHRNEMEVGFDFVLLKDTHQYSTT